MPDQTSPIDLQSERAERGRPSVRSCPSCDGDLVRLPHSAHYCPFCGSHLHAAPPTPAFSEPAFSTPASDVDGLSPESIALLEEAAANASVPECDPAIVRFARVFAVRAPAVPPTQPMPRANPPVPSPKGRRSPMVQGFARAMYLLGRRYERALGAQHNPTEAQRCYDKAAKLGNSAAIERLGESTVGD